MAGPTLIGQQLPFDKVSGFSGQWVFGSTRIDSCTGDILNDEDFGLGIISGFSIFPSVSGFSGQSGASSSSGISGFSGTSGVGFSGPSGPSGPSGVSGQSGHSGFSGGGSGVSGFTGFSGKVTAGDVASEFSSIALSTVGARLGFSSVSVVTIGFSGRLSAVRDSTSSLDIDWDGVIVGDLGLTGISGLDTGSETADQWYSVFVIIDEDNPEDVHVLFSATENTPTLPSGFTHFRRVGWVRNDQNSNILKFVQLWGGANRKYWWDDVVADHQVLAAGNATAFTLVDCSASVPPTTRDVTLRLDLEPQNANSEAAVRTPGFSGAIENLGMDVKPGTSRATTSRVFVATDDDQMIEYAVSVTQDELNIQVAGFADELDIGLT